MKKCSTQEPILWSVWCYQPKVLQLADVQPDIFQQSASNTNLLFFCWDLDEGVDTTDVSVL